MNSRQLWNSYQRHKFLRAKASRDIQKFRVSEMAFAGVFKRYIFHRGSHVVSSEYTQDWEQCCRNVPGVPRHRTVQTFHRSKPVYVRVQCHSKLGAYFLLAVMVDGDKGSRLRMAIQPAVLAGYRPLLTALHLLGLFQNLMTVLIHGHKSSFKPPEKMRGRCNNFSPEKGKG